MTPYLLIASRDPFESNDAGYFLDLAEGLARTGHQVTVYLVQNAVLTARPCRHAARLQSLRAHGVTVLADDLSLQERGIPAQRLIPEVAAAAIDTVVDALAAGHKTIWH